jgi:GH25 family lysozyme M1 (1,4-beta-N-acetylmuramidase)
MFRCSTDRRWLGMIRKLSFAIIALMLAVVPVSAATSYSEYTDAEYEHNSAYDSSLIVNGVDASYYQDTSSDWVSAKASGIDFAIFRITLTYANSGKLDTDSTFEEHYIKSGEAGLMRGVYVFSQALNAEEGRKEAEFAIKRLRELNIGPDDLDLPVYMDYEFVSGDTRLDELDAEHAIAAAKAFCETIQQNGYQAGVYANTGFFRNYLYDGTSLPKGTSLWCAQYNDKNDSVPFYSMWQYSSSGVVPYIYRSDTDKYDKVDVNYWYIDTAWSDPSDITVEYDSDTSYTGGPVLPELTVKCDGEKLEEGVDYTVRGINNVEAGSGAYAYIRGIGGYEGYILVPFNINSEGSDNSAADKECVYQIHKKTS